LARRRSWAPLPAVAGESDWIFGLVCRICCADLSVPTRDLLGVATLGGAAMILASEILGPETCGAGTATFKLRVVTALVR